MKISYYVSRRFFSRGLPFWFFPLVLFILLGIVLSWSLFSLHFNPSARIFDGLKSSLKGEGGDSQNEYSRALMNFQNRSYYTAGRQFRAIVENSGATPLVKQKSLLYYAFSLLLYGESQKDNILIQEAREAFGRLIRLVPKGSPLYLRAMWGHARASRQLDASYLSETGDALESFSKQLTSGSLKRTLSLELGYYYFTLNDDQSAMSSFRQSALSVDSPKFYDEALSQEGSEVILLQLLRAKQIPDKILYSYGSSIEQKLIHWALQYMNTGRIAQANSILWTLMNSFHTEETLEDIYFFAGYFAQREGYTKSALYYYQHVLNNGYLDKDPAAYFNLAVIYWNIGAKSKAQECLSIVSNQFPYTYYGIQAQKWLSALSSGSGLVDSISRVPELNSVSDFQDHSSAMTTKKYVNAGREPVWDSGNDNHPQPQEVPPAVKEEPQPQKPVVNVNINQSRSFLTNNNSNNTRTTLSRNEKDSRNTTSSSSDDHKDSGNTFTALSSRKDNRSSSMRNEQRSLEKDFEDSYGAPVIDDGDDDEDNGTVLFESKRNIQLPETSDSNSRQVAPSQDDLARDFDNLDSQTANRAK